MIVCSCNKITKSDIVATVKEFLRENPWQLITVGRVYHTLEKRGKCCGCFPNAIDIIVRTFEEWHAEQDTADNTVLSLVDRMRAQHSKTLGIRRRPNSGGAVSISRSG